MGQPKAVKGKKEPRLVIPELKQLGILSWDFDNNYPGRRRALIADSVTARNCLRIYNRYVFGKGLADVDFYKAVINSDDMLNTVDALVRRIIDDKGHIGGVAVHLNYNAAYEKVEARYVRIDDCRISLDKKYILVHPNWEKRPDLKKFDAKDVEKIHVFNPDPLVIEEQVAEAKGWDNYKGQIFFWTPNGLTYPVADWEAAATDVDTEPELSLFNNRAVKNNFQPSQIIVVPPTELPEGMPSGEVDPPAGGTAEGKSYSDVINETVQEYQGAENAASVMVIEKASPEDEINFHTPDLQHFDGMYSHAESSVDAKILRGFMMPPQLVLEGEGLFSSGEELESARAFYNDEITADDRLQMEEILRTIFEGWEYDICPSGDYSLIPFSIKKKITQEYFPYFDKNEIRESLGADPIEDDPTATQKTLAEIIGVGGVQALTAVLSNPELTPEQKRGTLEVVFGLPSADVDKLLGIVVTPANKEIR